MITESILRTWVPWRIPLLLIGLMLALDFLGGAVVQHALAWDRQAIAAGQWWRLWTGHLVHLSHYHLLLNVAGLLVLGLLCPQPLPALVWLRRLLVLGLGVGIGLLWAVPSLRWYVGMSGVIHGLFVLGLAPQIRRGDGIAIVCGLYLVGKVGWELYAGAPLSDEAAIGGRVITEAHALGVLSALGYGLVFGSFRDAPETVHSAPRST
ncbi:rhombosortase [Sinimarinibacterium sp. NLF-5-8]|uniref:rhombosortase n=1 Tax=Sinimarinibacterium sp. NLF-5-8 TaxID=2698684 RepID=UPI001EE43A47|nr:rhombosortase [Sinimarinibacterium sp. NLF-5-8]